MGVTPRVHERERTVTNARLKLSDAVRDWEDTEEYEALTEAEALQVLMSVFSDRILGWTKYQIRFERHGDHDTPGGWEKKA